MFYKIISFNLNSLSCLLTFHFIIRDQELYYDLEKFIVESIFTEIFIKIIITYLHIKCL